MFRWPFLAASIVAVATFGCASSPNPAETAAAAYTPTAGIQPAGLPDQTVEPTRLPAPNSSESHFNPIRLASRVSETANNPQGALFGPDPGLDELVAFAVANNPEIQAVHMQAHAMEARVPQVRALDDPMLITTTFLEPIRRPRVRKM